LINSILHFRIGANKMKAAIYARVSTDKQGREQTVDSQLDALRRWATAHGHELRAIARSWVICDNRDVRFAAAIRRGLDGRIVVADPHTCPLLARLASKSISPT
jgi:predicted site-specific integrase-resolvase